MPYPASREGLVSVDCANYRKQLIFQDSLTWGLSQWEDRIGMGINIGLAVWISIRIFNSLLISVNDIILRFYACKNHITRRQDEIADRTYSSVNICLSHIKTLSPIQNGQPFADDIFKRISLHENFWIWTTISMKYFLRCLIDNMAVLV